jgi:hypothetical protein
VIPRAFSSGALSIWSYAMKVPPKVSAITFVNAAVNVVLPWSTCPIVPTFTCGFVRANFSLAMARSSKQQRFELKVVGNQCQQQRQQNVDLGSY